MSSKLTETLSQLGQHVKLPDSPETAVLEAVPNPNKNTLYGVRFTCPEFTSLCPVTGQPDFAHFVIDYAPDTAIIESKSLKLFMHSFRNHAAFHEAVLGIIADRIIEASGPHWLRICGFFYPRGGIPIDVFFQTGEPPEGLYVPDPGVSPYMGRR